MYPKFQYWRSHAYLRWVASLPCIACGIEGFSQAAHSNQAKHGKGRSIKASDEFTFPLCAPHFWMMGCHYMHDNCIDMPKAARDAIEDGYIARTWAEAAQFGWRGSR
jgi:hypothetical protein